MKYISDVCGRLSKNKDGMEKNQAGWQSQPVTSAMVQASIDALTAKQKAIDDKNLEIAILQREAHTLSAEGNELADRVEALAVGIEGNNPEKLVLYGIKPRKPLVKKPACTTVLQVTLTDDVDGIGFIVAAKTDANADMYEWQKGISADPSKTDVIPEMKIYKTTIKTSFVDDDVAKGVRYFYRVRAVNASGEGPWSEAVSRVQ